jgi:hypothetical protein
MPAIQMDSEVDYSLIINVACILVAFGLIIAQYVIFTSHVETIQSDLEDHIFALKDRVDALEEELYGTEETEETVEEAPIETLTITSEKED